MEMTSGPAPKSARLLIMVNEFLNLSGPWPEVLASQASFMLKHWINAVGVRTERVLFGCPKFAKELAAR
ncbi:hypothetical protein ACQR1W_15070 [Bradyrhizobium sp. HKCCYLS1011]|uniref:hypothetical protein n=1 Tax=Bradyrhizobium sp. HKCCYLS1011 TaxID=3420733 RepID=UPI003EBD623F